MEKNLKSLLVRLTKESCCTNKKIKPKLTKIKLNLNRKKKKKIETKTSSSKNKEAKVSFVENEITLCKQKWT